MSAAINIFLFAGLMFGEPAGFQDLALECRTLPHAKAEPVNMPRATAYLVGGDEGLRLEDRYEIFDLWYCETVRSRWKDPDGNRLQICRIKRKVPGGSCDTRTRVDYENYFAQAVLGKKDLAGLDEAVYLLSPVEVARRVKPRRAMRQNLADLWQYETTNGNAAVFAFRPKIEGGGDADWYLVSAVSDDPDIFGKMDEWLDDVRASGVGGRGRGKSGYAATGEMPAESELLARDYRRSVINYSDWHFVSVTNVVVVDNLSGPDRNAFLAALTNTLPRLQNAYRRELPSPLSEDGHIAAIRVFGSREEYIAYVGEEMKWSAALWSPLHRELVMYCPERGTDALLRTVWHEAFHQYLSYACSMIQSSAWFNEGHAQLFENTHFDGDGNLVYDVDAEAVAFIKAHASRLAEYLPEFFGLDYPEFYADTHEERVLNYRLAWSVAYFLQIGAPEVRFQPFKNLRSDYMKSLVRTRHRDSACREVLTEQMLKDLVSEWLEFWKSY